MLDQHTTLLFWTNQVGIQLWLMTIENTMSHSVMKDASYFITPLKQLQLVFAGIFYNLQTISPYIQQFKCVFCRESIKVNCQLGVHM